VRRAKTASPLEAAKKALILDKSGLFSYVFKLST
jgi:hypothetical protein